MGIRIVFGICLPWPVTDERDSTINAIIIVEAFLIFPLIEIAFTENVQKRVIFGISDILKGSNGSKLA